MSDRSGPASALGRAGPSAGHATARRSEGQAERAYERACAAWLTGKHPVEQVEEAEQALDDARLARRRVEAARAHLDPLVPRLAGT